MNLKNMNLKMFMGLKKFLNKEKITFLNVKW